jgi:hypothetical protein
MSEMPPVLPAEVLEQLAGLPAVGTWEPVFPLLTSDPGGETRICLLSRAELEAEPQIVRCAIRSKRTSANLRRSRIAVLHVVSDTVSYAVRTRVGRIVVDDGGLATELHVTEVEQDTLGIPLRSMSFLADTALAVQERWDDNAALFARLTTPG